VRSERKVGNYEIEEEVEVNEGDIAKEVNIEQVRIKTD
jgi:hypothetical protein